MKKITTITLVVLGVTLISANLISKPAAEVKAEQEVKTTQVSTEEGAGIIESNAKSWN